LLHLFLHALLLLAADNNKTIFVRLNVIGALEGFLGVAPAIGTKQLSS
jgi:hypothetical protein